MTLSCEIEKDQRHTKQQQGTTLGIKMYNSKQHQIQYRTTYSQSFNSKDLIKPKQNPTVTAIATDGDGKISSIAGRNISKTKIFSML